MGTVNGKLIKQEHNQLDELTRKTEQIIRRCESLESQVSTLTKQDFTQYLQNVSYEVNHVKAFSHKLDKRISSLEEVISTQAKQLFFFKIVNVISLVGLLLMFFISHQPDSDNNQPQKQAQSLESLQKDLSL